MRHLQLDGYGCREEIRRTGDRQSGYGNELHPLMWMRRCSDEHTYDGNRNRGLREVHRLWNCQESVAISVNRKVQILVNTHILLCPIRHLLIIQTLVVPILHDMTISFTGFAFDVLSKLLVLSRQGVGSGCLWWDIFFTAPLRVFQFQGCCLWNKILLAMRDSRLIR